MKKIGVLILLILILISCGKNIQKDNLRIEKVWDVTGMTPSNSSLCIDIYKNHIYYIEDLGEKFAVVKRNIDGEKISAFDVPKGKGPGEAMHTLGLKVNNDRIYFTDFVLRRTTMFSLDGEYLDSFEFGSNTGVIISFDFLKDSMFFHSINRAYIGRMEIDTGEVVATKKHHLKKMIEPGDKIRGGVLALDKNSKNIYIGNISKPYRIEKFNYDFEKVDEFKYKVGKDIEPTQVAPGPNIYGDQLVTSLCVSDNYVYAPEIGARMFITNNGGRYKKYNPNLLAFNKKNGEVEKIFTNKRLRDVEGSFNIVGVTDDYIVTFFITRGHIVKELLDKDPEKFVYMFVLLRRPS